MVHPIARLELPKPHAETHRHEMSLGKYPLAYLHVEVEP